MNARELKKQIRRSLIEQGFSPNRNGAPLSSNMSKDAVRNLHTDAVRHKIDTASRTLRRREFDFLECFAAGKEISVEAFDPVLVEVTPHSFEELLFRYVVLHWSIPVSSGYGRRIRFLVKDQSNGKLVGVIGLGDPVINLASRDSWIGWSRSRKSERLRHVMDAFVLGAVPPYSLLLGGKLVAMLAVSNEVRAAFSKKYRGTSALITKRPFDGRLALVTTTSALGRSSIYNRLRYQETLLYQHAGFTTGSGDFQFLNGLYDSIRHYALTRTDPTAKSEDWGTGFRNRREVVRKTLLKLGLPDRWLYHGIKREVFAVPAAKNTQQFLRGEHSRLRWLDLPSSDIGHFFKGRWMLQRSESRPEYLDWEPSAWQLWD